MRYTKCNGPLLLCRVDGSGVLVAEGVGPVQAHLDLHFRLMQHDLLAELVDATCCFKDLGGIKWLDDRQRRQVRCCYCCCCCCCCCCRLDVMCALLACLLAGWLTGWLVSLCHILAIAVLIGKALRDTARGLGIYYMGR
jgi:hypothetical protein